MPVNRHGVEAGVFLGIGNALIFNHFMPSVADVKTGQPFDPVIEGSERTALLATTALTVIVAGGLRSWETFAVAGLTIVVLDFAYKHANAVHPDTGKMVQPESGQLDNVHPLPDYTTGDAATAS